MTDAIQNWLTKRHASLTNAIAACTPEVDTTVLKENLRAVEMLREANETLRQCAHSLGAVGDPHLALLKIEEWFKRWEKELGK